MHSRAPAHRRDLALMVCREGCWTLELPEGRVSHRSDYKEVDVRRLGELATAAARGCSRSPLQMSALRVIAPVPLG